jgi:hypothetical protein
LLLARLLLARLPLLQVLWLLLLLLLLVRLLLLQAVWLLLLLLLLVWLLMLLQLVLVLAYGAHTSSCCCHVCYCFSVYR